MASPEDREDDGDREDHAAEPPAGPAARAPDDVVGTPVDKPPSAASPEPARVSGDHPDEPPPDVPAPRPQPIAAADSELTDEDRAVLPADTPLRRMFEDRRVRIATIAGVPILVALFAAAAIFAHSFGIARSVRLDGAAALPPGAGTALRVSYAEMDEYGLPHEIPFERARLEVCPADGAHLPPSAPPAGRGEPPTPGCLLLGDAPGRGHGKDVELQLQVPAVPPGTHPVRLEIRAPDKDVAYRFPVVFDAEARTEPARRENGRGAALRLGASGITVDIVPLTGGIARGSPTTMVVRALGPDGAPSIGELFLLPIGETVRARLPASIRTDRAGLAQLDLQTPFFEYRFAISTAPFPQMDPVEVDVGLLPSEVLDRAALFEVGFEPMLGPLWIGDAPDVPQDRPFLREGSPLFAALDRPDAQKTTVFAEVWSHGRLVRLATGESPGAPVTFGDFELPPGLAFVQLHKPGEPEDSVVGRHIWVGDDDGATADTIGALVSALAWPSEEMEWVHTVRQRLEELDAGTLERLGRYVLARRDPIWYPPAVLFDSRPGDRQRASELREGIKQAMAWGIGILAFALVALAAYVGIVTAQFVRRQRGLGSVVTSTATAEGEAPRSMYDRSPWWVQHTVLLRTALVFLIVAAALAGIALLVWSMKQAYWAP